jgi:hypothetical protein
VSLPVWFSKCYPLLRNIFRSAACYLATTRSLLFVVTGMWFQIHCSAMNVCSGTTIPAFSRHVTIWFSQVPHECYMALPYHFSWHITLRTVGKEYKLMGIFENVNFCNNIISLIEVYLFQNKALSQYSG